jgi:GxxExxY protein
MDVNALSKEVIGAAIEVHRCLGPGMLESVYQQCLARELELRGLGYQREYSVSIKYKGLEIGHAFAADFLVESCLVLELKSVELIAEAHKAQLLTYLRWCNLSLGLLLNFGASRMRDGIHRVVNNL